MSILIAVLLAVFGLSAALHLVQVASVMHHLRRRPPARRPGEPVSILKPLCGDIEGLAENLESFAHLRYARYEILLGCKEGGDTALPVARAFQRRHPELPIRIVVDGRQFGHNPKVNNLVPLMEKARHDLVLISDDNVRVDADYLTRTVAEMGARTALVYNLIRGTGGRSLGALLENLHLNSFITGSMCFLHKLCNHPCVVGKSMLLRRSLLRQLGGWQTVCNVLAEDYVLGRHLQRCGYEVALCAHQISNVNVTWPVRKFMSRHARWAKMRFWIGGPRYLSEWLGNPMALALLVFALHPALFTAGVLSATVLGRIGFDALLARALRSDLHSWHFLLVPLKDLMIALLWFVPFGNRTITWRQKKFRLGRGSVLRPHRHRQPAPDWQSDPLPVTA